jgi:hypothetical protein
MTPEQEDATTTTQCLPNAPSNENQASIHEAHGLVHDSSKSFSLTVLSTSNGRKLSHLLAERVRLLDGRGKVAVQRVVSLDRYMAWRRH